MKQTLISLKDQNGWKAALMQVPYSFGHTWESCYAMSLSTGLDTYLYHFEDNNIHIICPLSERSHCGFTDIYTPYGFSGFVSNFKCEEFTEIWKKFVEEKNYVCGYITMNPLLKDSIGYFNAEATTANDLYAIDLNLSLEKLIANLSTNRKRQVKKHDEILTTLSYDKAILKSFFLENFHAFFENRDASLFSSLTKETLSYLVDLENVILIGKIIDSKVEAVSVFAYTPFVAEYIFNISIPKGKSHTVPLLWEGIRKLKEMGVPTLNLGGGIKRGDSLSEFKERFGAEKYPFSVLKQVYNKKVFQQLCEASGVSDQDHYFPPYRKVSAKNSI